MEFEDWFNQIVGYGLLGEQFYSDLDYYTQQIKEYYNDEKEYADLQRNLVGWLREAYQAGYEEGRKEKEKEGY
mgnify:CR=1 FL=1